ncbi:peptidase M48 Ste24p [Lysobacter arseniciresistens ZS79]|uniref:Peptidase M48 Ste24p n=1 Tax=Lysobacter arseniciresistens ZS79 TaxID=913325 RepID=A0A0A0F7U4_9GAMM|nr:M48 family metallopeptidase [Lysobacter arseniciresistens]KGM57422.1 peptidase M48 Ste24p [Lysobacter arseniciresistens ZS79]
MNFFERQAAARRASTRLVVLFALAVLAIVLAVDALAWALSGGSGGALVVATVLTLATIGLGSLYRLASLGGGGEVIAAQLGGTPVAAGAVEPDLRRLRNVVEEVAIASGVPVPGVYVLEHEAGINAFAAGHGPADAVVAVTRGALDRLNRDELQGVVAHEFAHILNGDMRLNLRLVGVLYGISMLGLIGRHVLDFGRIGLGGRDRRGAGMAVGVMVAAAVMIVIGWIGLLFARLIRAGVSRQRERLADASAVQFTRQPAGLAGALKKIGGLPDGSVLVSSGDAEEVSHMLFGEGLGFEGRMADWLATHPPLVERIRALEPGFSDRQLATLSARWMDHPPHGLQEDLHLGLTGDGALPSARSEQAVEPGRVSGRVGSPDRDDHRRADAVVGELGEELRALARDRDRAIALVLGLMLDPRADVAQRQLFGIGARLGEAVARDVRELHDRHLEHLHPMLRLPLVELAFPVLRRRPRPQLDLLLDAVEAVSRADGEVSLFEYCLGRLLRVQLHESLRPARYATFGRRKPGALAGEIATLLAVVADAGHADEASARHAFLAGMRHILPNQHVAYRAPQHPVPALEEVWPTLDLLHPLAKRVLVEAVTVAASHDGRVSVAEAELLRTVCAILHCPLPPLLGAEPRTRH